MDYSTLPNDPDHPVGTSPWQSSPQPNVQNFGQPEPGSGPSSPLAKHSTPYADGSLPDSEEGSGNEQPERRQHRTEDNSGSTEGNSADSTPGRSRGPPLNGEGHQGQPYQQQQRPENLQQNRPHPGTPYQQQPTKSSVPSRYHIGARTQRQNLPQYKLQAKITGLERTGRKDPVLRFDVHVCMMVNVHSRLR